jgi:predicted methyltransferase
VTCRVSLPVTVTHCWSKYCCESWRRVQLWDRPHLRCGAPRDSTAFAHQDTTEARNGAPTRNLTRFLRNADEPFAAQHVSFDMQSPQLSACRAASVITRTTVMVVLAVALPAAAASQPRARSERSAREVELAIEALGLKAGDTIAEVGAGDARFSFRFAEVVGPKGRVYANELGASRVRRIQETAEQRHLANVIAVEGAVDDTKLPDSCCDHIMMRHVYHMLTDPEPMTRSFYRALKPGGTLLILEGDPQPGRANASGVPANRAGMGIDPQIVIEELSAAGFAFERRVADWVGSDYALAFRKPQP